MAATRYPTFLSDDEERALTEDILVRLKLQRIKAANHRVAVEAEMGISRTLCQEVAKGRYQPTRGKVTAEKQQEIKRRHRIWQQAHEQSRPFTLAALSARYGICTTAICNRISAVKRQLAAQKRQATNQTERREAA